MKRKKHAPTRYNTSSEQMICRLILPSHLSSTSPYIVARANSNLVFECWRPTVRQPGRIFVTSSLLYLPRHSFLVVSSSFTTVLLLNDTTVLPTTIIIIIYGKLYVNKYKYYKYWRNYVAGMLSGPCLVFRLELCRKRTNRTV